MHSCVGTLGTLEVLIVRGVDARVHDLPRVPFEAKDGTDGQHGVFEGDERAGCSVGDVRVERRDGGVVAVVVAHRHEGSFRIAVLFVDIGVGG